MSDALRVDWIEQIKRDQDAEARLIEEHSRYCALAEALGKSEGLACFERILKEIKLQAVGCSEIGATVRISDVRRPADIEAGNHVYRIDVHSAVGWASTTYMDLSYTEGDSRIRCFPRDTDSFNIELRPNKKGSPVTLGPKGELKTEAEAARLILEPLVRSVIGR